MKIYCNNQFVEKETLGEVLEQGYLFGWGVFETFRPRGGNIPFLNEHIGRLRDGAKFLQLECPDLDYKQIILSLMAQNDLEDAYVRINVFKKRKGAGCIIQVSEFDYYKEEDYQKGAKIIFSDIIRYSKDEFLSVKSLSYVKNRIAWLAAQKQQKEEAIFLNERWFLQEGSRSNIFLVKNKKVFTPGLSCGLLAGVTRKAVIDICRDNKIKIVEGEFTKTDLLNCDEVFLTSSLMGIMPVAQAADRSFNIDKFTVTPKIRKLYKKLI